MIKIVKKNGDPLFKTISPRTRLKFSIYVIIANFILGIIGMLLGTDLTALGVFLTMANTPLFAYILGESFKPSVIPESYYNQQHSGSGGLSKIEIKTTSEQSIQNTQQPIQDPVPDPQPPDPNQVPQPPQPLKRVQKNKQEIG